MPTSISKTHQAELAAFAPESAVLDFLLAQSTALVDHFERHIADFQTDAQFAALENIPPRLSLPRILNRQPRPYRFPIPMQSPKRMNAASIVTQICLPMS
jgi:hypothetical protein